MTDTSTTNTPPAPGAPAPTPADLAGTTAPPAPGAPAPTDPPAAAENPWEDPAKAKAEIERLRRENGDARINAKSKAAEDARTELAKTIMGVLDPDAAKGTPTVESLTQAVTAKEGELISAKNEARVLRAAIAAGVTTPDKIELLEFKLSRSDEFRALDATADNYAATLGTIVTALTAADPSLRSSGTIVATGTDQLGGAAGGSSEITPEQFASMDMPARNKLFTENRELYNKLAHG